MKTIALIMTEMETGGVSEALIEMLSRFDYDRYSVTLWLGKGIGPEQSRLDPRVEIRYWGQDEPLSTPLKRGQVLTFLHRTSHRLLGRYYIKCNDKHTYHCVRSLPDIGAECYDYVICYQGVSPLAIPNALCRIRGREKILWIHGDLGREGAAYPFCKKLYHRFDRAIAVSSAARDLFVEQYGYPVERTAVFHNLVDAAQILRQAAQAPEQPMEQPAIVTVGRLSPEKGQIMIPAAMRRLLDEGLDAYWYLVGDGVCRADIQAEIEKYGLGDRVILLGRKENPFPYMKAAQIYVQTSFTEGWCLTVQEARLLGKCVVSTPLPAIMEQITDGENGLICADASPEALARSVSTLLQDPALCQQLAEGPGHSLPDPTDEMERLYSILENKDCEVSS